MRKLIFISILLFMAASSTVGQTYKLESVFYDNISETYLSHMKNLDSDQQSENLTFILWGYQKYSESWIDGMYEVEYFKGDAKQIYEFLSGVVAFGEKYSKEDKVQTHILGTKVKTFNQSMFKYTFVYEPDERVACKFKAKHWESILDDLTSYCKKNKIEYK